jgi:hypothetical protein
MRLLRDENMRYIIEHHDISGCEVLEIFQGTRHNARARAKQLRRSEGVVGERWLPHGYELTLSGKFIKLYSHGYHKRVSKLA